MISIRTREEDVKDMVKVNRRRYVSYRNAAENFHVSSMKAPMQRDVRVASSKYDTCLRKFQYSKALDCVMLAVVVNKAPHVTVALMQELIRREGLKRALAGRDGKSLVGIIRFLNKHIGSPRFGRVLLHVANALLGKFTRLRDSRKNFYEMTHITFFFFNSYYLILRKIVYRTIRTEFGND